ncbi:uncharacterized protein LOC132303672 [Cornus florida]|uniref:uncharacterized protein LOC132303672 n=1 Tax=Cornus florida TaxID=4283 RepID=UPI0028991B84|nr:uncharacterized protein LOC132303672 [Cornus florida]
MGKPQGSSNLGEELHAAARSGDLNAVQLICSSNPFAINSRDKHSRTPLHLAAWSGHAEVVSYLCKNKADIGAAAMDDMGAIHFAAQKGHLEVVRILLSSGISVKSCNRKGTTALHYAVQGSHLELVKYLVKKGASLNAKTKAGKTPIDLASSEEIRSLLTECKEASKKKDLNSAGKAEEAHPESSVQENTQVSGGEASVAMHEAAEHENEKPVKRKGDEDETKESVPGTKKAKVALNHLLAADDAQEEEDDQ